MCSPRCSTLYNNNFVHCFLRVYTFKFAASLAEVLNKAGDCAGKELYTYIVHKEVCSKFKECFSLYH